MLSVETSEVSKEPGRAVCNTWNRKFDWSAFHARMRSTQKYCAPTVELMFSHWGASGAAGGFSGFGPTCQNPQDIPTRYGRTRSFDK